MIQEGYCIRGGTDEPLDERARCLPHDEIAIPPSWGHSRQRWVDGAWSPEVAKKAGYIYKPKFGAAAPPATNEQRPRVCVQCHMPLPGAVQGPSKQLYCGARCKNKAAWARRVEGRVAS